MSPRCSRDPFLEPMKRRKPRLSFDSDGSDVSETAAPPPCKRPLGARPSVAKQGADDSPSSCLAEEAVFALLTRKPKRPEKKAYAWMDSGDEHDSAAETESARRGSSASSDEGSMQPTTPKSGGAEPTKIVDIQTFSEFLRAGPELKRRCSTMPVAELVALCETAVRLRFYDPDLFGDVCVQLCVRLRAGALTVLQTTDAVASLAELNSFDTRVLRAAGAFLSKRITEMTKAQRLLWLKLLAAAGPDAQDEAFTEALRMAPLPMGEASAADDDFFLCWEFVRGGHCPRGAKCRWVHPEKKK